MERAQGLIVNMQRILVALSLIAASTTALGAEPAAQSSDPDAPAASAAGAPVASDIEQVKKSLLELKRDLVILEEDLLFPASSQLAVFLSMDVGDFFQLDSVTVEIDGEQVAHHLYTERQADALYRGGVQKLYVGNVKQGAHRLTAFFTGRGPSGRDYRRAATVEVDKSFDPAYVELAIKDSSAKYQPEFVASVSD
ncbi:MAG: AraC family transcriptional regulator [Pseudomonadales bacterium]